MSNPHDYTVAWICALSTERVAAEAFLDEEHELPVSISPHDNNNYKLGKIGRHMVVIAVLPDGEYGKSSAACVATSLLHTFPNVRVGLMVGIRGGAPSQKNDIRLGDIVVGTTRGGKSGVLHYDFGDKIQNQPLQLTGFMNQAPPSLRAAVSGLKAHYEGHGHTIKDAIDKALVTRPRLKKKYKYPGDENDGLYQSHMIRQIDEDEGCSGSGDEGDSVLIHRPQRSDDDDNPMIHYGVIASGDQLMMDASIRDRLSRDYHVLCFEMEAAGLVNHFPCLIIRGICDYSDTHKNDQWQGYSAMVAAAYAKDLLLQIIPSRIDNEAKIVDVLSEMGGLVNNVIEELKPVSKIIHTKHDRDILNWLTIHDYAISHKDIFTKAEPGTGQWFLDTPAFQTWLNNDTQRMLCCGNPGAGKTIITSIVVDHLLSESQQGPDVGIAYIYCNYQRHTQQTATDILSSLLRQLAQARSPLPRSIQDLYERHGKYRTHPTLEQILEGLFCVAGEYSKVYIIIDALDKCNASNNTRATVLKEVFRLQKHMAASIFATSRPNKEVSNFFSGSLTLNITATDDDIRRYLDKQISLKKSLIIDDPLKAEIEDKIVTIADGMFLLASLQTGTVLSQPTKGDLLETLETLNKGELGLDDHYHQAMSRIQDQEPKRKALAMKILTWIVHSKRSLTLLELQHALAVRKNTKELDPNFIPHPEIILSLCAGLVVLDEESTIVRLVHYTTQEYFEREQERWFEDPETEITITCVTYLLFDCFDKDDPRVYTWTRHTYRETYWDLKVYLDTHHSLYDYSAYYWGHHAKSATEQVSGLLLCFLTSGAHVNFCGYVMMPCIEMFDSPVMVSGLHLAAHFGLWSLARYLLDDGFDPDQRDSNRRTPLSYAAESGQETIVRLLLARDDVDPDTSSKDSICGRRTPLMLAAMNGHKGVVNLISGRSDIDINVRDANGTTALCWAVRSRDISIVARLLEKGGDLEMENIYGRTILAVAAEYGDLKMVTFLLENGALPSPKLKSKYGKTPLTFAVIYGHETVVKSLLGVEGVLIDVEDPNGQSPLFHAAGNGHEGIVKLLLERGADPQLRERDEYGRYPIHCAAEGGHVGVVKVLLQREVNPDLLTGDSRTPFSLAAGNGHIAIAKQLLATGKVDPDSKASGEYSQGRTPLSYAAEEGHETIVELLLDTCGVDPDSRATGWWVAGKTPLMFAASRKRLGVVRTLPNSNRVNLDARDTHKSHGDQTPLSFAARGRSQAIVRLLLDTGKVDINSTCNGGKTPLDYAEDEAIKRFLCEKGAKYGRDL